MNPLQAIAQAALVLNSPCREQARLHSLEIDGQLSQSQRTAVRIHAFMCTGCSRYRKQLGILRDAARRIGKVPAHLPPDVRTRVLTRLSRH